MPEEIAARGLETIEILPIENKPEAIITLTDVDQKSSSFAITPEALGILLAEALRLAGQWAGEPDLKAETADVTGPRNALPAQRIALERGRHSEETALHVYLGDIELTFLLPLPKVLEALTELRKALEPKSIH
jgi:hypothetical protein